MTLVVVASVLDLNQFSTCQMRISTCRRFLQRYTGVLQTILYRSTTALIIFYLTKETTKLSMRQMEASLASRWFQQRRKLPVRLFIYLDSLMERTKEDFLRRPEPSDLPNCSGKSCSRHKGFSSRTPAKYYSMVRFILLPADVSARLTSGCLVVSF